jgi:hypothetical protein
MFLFTCFLDNLNVLKLKALNLLQMILKQKLRGQGVAFLVAGGSGTTRFPLLPCYFCSLDMQNGHILDFFGRIQNEEA